MPDSISKLDSDTLLAWQDTAKDFNGVDESHDILAKKKIHWVDKKFLFFFDTPGKTRCI